MAPSNLPIDALGAADRDFLLRVSTFLIRIVAPKYIQRAMAAGYINEEHEEGWRLQHLAGGAARPLAHSFAQRDLRYSDSVRDEDSLLVRLDDFENRWFPITKFIIRRKVAREDRDRFADAFFRGLSQQPKGSAVAGSVTKLLARVDDLETSDEPGAKAVRATLRARGFDAEATEARRLLERLKEYQLPEEPVEVQAVQESLEAQRVALEELRDWFYDWATTLRPHFRRRERIALGLSRPSSSTVATVAEEEESVEDEAEAPEDEAESPEDQAETSEEVA